MDQQPPRAARSERRGNLYDSQTRGLIERANKPQNCSYRHGILNDPSVSFYKLFIKFFKFTLHQVKHFCPFFRIPKMIINLVFLFENKICLKKAQICLKFQNNILKFVPVAKILISILFHKFSFV